MSSLKEHGFVVDDAGAALPALPALIAESVTATASVNASNLRSCHDENSSAFLDLRDMITAFTKLDHSMAARAALPTRFCGELKDRLQSWILGAISTVERPFA